MRWVVGGAVARQIHDRWCGGMPGPWNAKAALQQERLPSTKAAYEATKDLAPLERHDKEALALKACINNIDSCGVEAQRGAMRAPSVKLFYEKVGSP